MLLICGDGITRSKESVPVAYFKQLIMMTEYIYILFLISHSLFHHFSVSTSSENFTPPTLVT